MKEEINMKTLTLKKSAAAIQVLAGELSNLRAEFNNGLTCIVSIHGKLEQTLQEAANNLDENLVKFGAYAEVMYELRSKVSSANHKCGIDKILNQLAETETKLSVYQMIAKTKQFDIEMIRRQMISAVNRAERDTSGYATEEFRVACVNKVTADKASKEVSYLKRYKRESQDELLLANITNTIELSEEAEKILKDLAVI